MERWTILFVLVVFIYYARRKLSEHSKAWVGRTADVFTRISPAAAGWQGNGGGGIDLSSIDRGAQRTGFYARHAAYYGGLAAASGVALAGRGYANRRRDIRNNKRSLRNLEIMEQRRHVPMIETETHLPDIKDQAGNTVKRRSIQKAPSPHHAQPYENKFRMLFQRTGSLNRNARARSQGLADRLGMRFDRRDSQLMNPRPTTRATRVPRTPPVQIPRRAFIPRIGPRLARMGRQRWRP
jgi:hypothetical protein